MKNWLQNLSAREQRLLKVGVTLVVLALLWVLVYLPTNRYLSSQADIKQRLEQQLQQMQGMVQSSGRSVAKTLTPIPANMTFSSWLDQQLSLVNLQDMVNRTEPIDANTISVWLQGAPFDQVIDWLQLMADKHGVLVDQIDVNVVDRSLGLTNIRMRLIK